MYVLHQPTYRMFLSAFKDGSTFIPGPTLVSGVSSYSLPNKYLNQTGVGFFLRPTTCLEIDINPIDVSSVPQPSDS